VSFNSLTPSVCAVSGATVTLIAVGACTIQATQAGNADYAAATPVNQSFQMTPAQAAPAPAQTYTISTFAGNGYGAGTFEFGGSSGDNGPAASAELFAPSSVAVDASGDLYIADTYNAKIRKVSKGIITTVAGTGKWGYSGDNGPATSAELDQPFGVAVDASGNVYIADTYNNVVRKVSNGIITAFAGNGYGAGPINLTTGNYGGYSGDGGPATKAELDEPEGVAVDSAGNVYIADSGNNVIRKVSHGVITTFAGDGYGAGSYNIVSGTGTCGIAENGTAANAEFCFPEAVTVDAAGNVYISDTNNYVVRVVSNGMIATFAGNGMDFGYFNAGGPATAAPIGWPTGLAVDAFGSVYIVNNYDNEIHKVSGGLITTIAGPGPNGGGYSGDGGPATSAEFDQPMGVAVNASGDVYIGDTGNNVVRLLTPMVAVPLPVVTGIGVSGGGTNIAQNAWVSIYGSNLAPASVGAGGLTWSSAPSFASGEMPTSLDGVSVTVNGIPAYVYFICPTQINVLTPLDSTTGPVAVVVNNGATIGAAYTAQMAAVSPGFLRYGDGVHIVAQHADYSLVGPASMSSPGYTFTPAVPGEVIALYGDGFGLPVTTLTAGSEYQSGALPEYPQITIGGVTAAVQYAAVISPGLYQINVLVPAVPASGDNQVIATYEGASSPAGAMIPIA
jgi:uncharacterized protein (TIGR03437 family)